MVYKKLYFAHRGSVGLLIICLILISCSANDRRDESPYVEQNQYIPVRTYYPKEYNPYNQPYSRYYTNPYGYPPRNYYPYYDSDQYYVPPSNYYGFEQDNYYRGGSVQARPGQNADGVGGKY